MKPLVLDGANISEIPTANPLELRAATTANASLNIPHGTAPTSPANGDVWTTSAGIYVRINGVTVGPLSAGGGGGSGVWTHIETLSPSASATIQSTGFAGFGYRVVWFDLNLTVSSNDATLLARYIVGGSVISSGDYHRAHSHRTSGGNTAVSDATTGTAIFLCGSTANFGVGNAAGKGLSGEMKLYSPDNTTIYKKSHVSTTYYSPTSNINSSGAASYVGATSAVGGVEFSLTAGTMTGTIAVYGLT